MTKPFQITALLEIAVTVVLVCAGCRAHRFSKLAGVYRSANSQSRMKVLRRVVEKGDSALMNFIQHIDMREPEKAFIRDYWRTPNLKNNVGDCPLHIAAKKGYRTALEVLIALGGEVDAQGEYEQTLLFDAENREIASILIVNGADVNAPDLTGYTPLHQAVLLGKLDLVEFLLKHGAEVNTQECNMGDTPLHTAILSKRRSIRIVKLLLEHGANVNALSHGECTPLYFANELGLEEFELLFVRHGANLPENK